MGHSYGTLLWDTLLGHSCGTLLWDTLVGHSSGTLLWDTLVGHSCRKLLRGTLLGHSCRTLLWVTLTGHSCGTLLRDNTGRSCATLLRDTLSGTLLWDTLVGNWDTLVVGHSYGTLLWDTLLGHSCGTLLSLTSDMPRLHQHVSGFPVARRIANVLSTKAAQIPMAMRHHERIFATRSAQTLEANISHDTTNHPARQRHAAFTPACFALPRGTAPRKHTSHQGRANRNGTATSRTYFRRTVCPYTRSKHIVHDTTNHPAHQRHAAFTPACFALPSGTAPRKRTLHQGRANLNVNGTATSRTSCRHTICPHTTSVSYKTSSKSHAYRLQNERFVRDFLQQSHVKSPKRAFHARLPQKLTCQSL